MDDQPTTTALLLDIQNKLGNTNSQLERLNGQVQTLTSFRRDHELEHAKVAGRIEGKFEATSQLSARTWTVLTLMVSTSGVLAAVIGKLV